MRFSSTLSVLLFSLLLGCSEVGLLDNSAVGTCGAESCFNGDGGLDADGSETGSGIGSDAGDRATGFNALCGAIVCDPDDGTSLQCTAAAPESDAGDEPADAASDALEADASEGDTGSTGVDAPDDVADSGTNPSKDLPGLVSCRVTASSGERTTVCGAAGSGTDSDPCVTSSDCSPGLACVGDANTGVCHPYCCRLPDACAEGTYCGVMASRDELLSSPDEPFLVPVCVPGNDCDLLPSLDGTNGCADGRICTVVRGDGTTACLLPGTAVEGESCGSSDIPGYSPCAEGFVCSKATNTCLALCRVTDPNTCGDGVCQGGTRGMPDPYGVCVGVRRN